MPPTDGCFREEFLAWNVWLRRQAVGVRSN